MMREIIRAVVYMSIFAAIAHGVGYIPATNSNVIEGGVFKGTTTFQDASGNTYLTIAETGTNDAMITSAGGDYFFSDASGNKILGIKEQGTNGVQLDGYGDTASDSLVVATAAVTSGYTLGLSDGTNLQAGLTQAGGIRLLRNGTASTVKGAVEYTISMDFAACVADCNDITVGALGGFATAEPCIAQPVDGTLPGTEVDVTCWASAANTVTVRMCGTVGDPAAEDYEIIQIDVD